MTSAHSGTTFEIPRTTKRRASTTAMLRHQTPLPTTREVIPGALVNIVLKADQPTGRTVSGTVRDVLTRGNHPRGIKVRLSDGRVGRVQSIASGGTHPGGILGDSGENRDVSALQETWTQYEGGDGREYRPPLGQGRRMRQDGADDDIPAQQFGLHAYVKPARQKGKGKGTRGGQAPGASENSAGQAMSPDESAKGISQPGDSKAGTVTCPVCNAFEGDEATVAHHVASHFDT